MKLIEKVQADMVDAMRAHQDLRLSVLRMLKTALKNKEAEEIGVLQTLVKQRHESVEQFTKGNRPDLAEKEKREIVILERYLPAAAGAEEMDAAITAAIAETGATSAKQMGAVVKAARTRLTGKTIDGKALSDSVRSRLGG